MSATYEEAVNCGTDRAATDAATAGHQEAGVNEEMLQDSSDTVTIAEPGSNNDRLSAAADVVSEPEVTNISSETSNSSQGLAYFHLSLSVIFLQFTCIVLFCTCCFSVCLSDSTVQPQREREPFRKVSNLDLVEPNQMLHWIAIC